MRDPGSAASCTSSARLIAGASDDDPSGIATYCSAGASFGFNLLWSAPASLPLIATVQYQLLAKIGMVSGLGLAGVLRRHYSKWVLYPAVLSLSVANTINAGTDTSSRYPCRHIGKGSHGKGKGVSPCICAELGQLVIESRI